MGLRTIHLQGIGSLPAIPAEEIRIGDVLSWNYSYNGYEVVAMKGVSAHFIEIVEKDRQKGTHSTRRLKRTRLVAVSRLESGRPMNK